MKKGRDKKPGFAGPPPSVAKKASVGRIDPDDYRNQTPLWGFRLLDASGGPWSWDNLTPKATLQILVRLRHLSERLWSEIFRDRSNNEIEVSALCNRAQQRLAERCRDTYDVLVKLRVDGPGRIWGIRDGRVLHILGWDPGHEVYPMNIADN